MIRNKRIEDILKRFFQGEKLSTKMLSYKYGVGERVIQKDLKELKEKYPIQRKKGEYFIHEEYLITDIQKIHPLALDMAMNIIKKTLPNYIDIIQDSLNTEITDIFLFDFEIEEIKDEKLFLNLKQSIIQNIAIKFQYNSHTKNVFPLKISNFNSYWYLIAYDLESSIIKSFYLDNIKNLSFHNESFLDSNKRKSLQQIQITSSWYNDNPKKTKLILFDEAKKYILRRTPSNIKILKQNDKNLEIEFHYFNEIEILNFIKKWLTHIKILDEKLKSDVKNLLIEALNNL